MGITISELAILFPKEAKKLVSKAKEADAKEVEEADQMNQNLEFFHRNPRKYQNLLSWTLKGGAYTWGVVPLLSVALCSKSFPFFFALLLKFSTPVSNH